ncbi:MAG: hypothetical protein A2381_03080 [Bdellovibrionales bacterium RIFOXYB1_FULL_37_110]|nr:MAG: hypothetical protein A2381_03080 [Bdellovibrionales bacterium RIFOXYB1_FULL_37_110]
MIVLAYYLFVIIMLSFSLASFLFISVPLLREIRIIFIVLLITFLFFFWKYRRPFLDFRLFGSISFFILLISIAYSSMISRLLVTYLILNK